MCRLDWEGRALRTTRATIPSHHTNLRVQSTLPGTFPCQCIIGTLKIFCANTSRTKAFSLGNRYFPFEHRSMLPVFIRLSYMSVNSIHWTFKIKSKKSLKGYVRSLLYAYQRHTQYYAYIFKISNQFQMNIKKCHEYKYNSSRLKLLCFMNKSNYSCYY